MGSKSTGLTARLEMRLDQKTKTRIQRAARGYGNSVGDFLRGLCLAELARRQALGDIAKGLPKTRKLPQAILPPHSARKKRS